jgi:hypothetical protein
VLVIEEAKEQHMNHTNEHDGSESPQLPALVLVTQRPDDLDVHALLKALKVLSAPIVDETSLLCLDMANPSSYDLQRRAVQFGAATNGREALRLAVLDGLRDISLRS